MDIIKIIENRELEHVYQPLWDLSVSDVFGYESLLRISDQSAVNIEAVFISAREQGNLFVLDTLSIEGAIKQFPLYQYQKELLFINIFPSTLIHPKFVPFIQSLISEFPEISGRVVFELNETIKEIELWNIPLLQERIQMLKNYQFLIALDDVGKGVCTLQKIIEFSPDYIKLDRYFSNELSTSKEKQQMVSMMNDYCQNGTGLVLEGIEKENDLLTAMSLHVPFVQGYLLGKPEKVHNQKGIGKGRHL